MCLVVVLLFSALSRPPLLLPEALRAAQDHFFAGRYSRAGMLKIGDSKLLNTVKE